MENLGCCSTEAGPEEGISCDGSLALGAEYPPPIGCTMDHSEVHLVLAMDLHVGRHLLDVDP